MKWLHGVFGARYRYCPLTGCDETGGKPIRPSTRYATALIAPALSVAVAVDSKFGSSGLSVGKNGALIKLRDLFS